MDGPDLLPAGPLAAGVCSRRYRRHHRPQRRHSPECRFRLAGGHLQRRISLRRRCRRLLDCHPGPVLRHGKRAPELGLHPVHHQTRTAARGSTGRRTEDRPRRPSRRPQRQPQRHHPLQTLGLQSRRQRLPSRIAGRRELRHRRRSPGPDCSDGRRHPGPRLQRRTDPGRGGALRPRTGRQRGLPRRRRRLLRRLPRGIHDPRARSPAGRSGQSARSADRAERGDPEKPPGLRRALRRRHLPDHADHLLRARLRGRLETG